MINVDVVNANYSLYTNDDAKKCFTALDQLLSRLSATIDPQQRQQIQSSIQRIELVVRRELNGPDHMGGTPVQGAAHARDLYTLRKLIAAGADLSIPEPFYGGSVLHVAVEGGSLECVKELMQHIPQLASRENPNGVTPIAWAQQKRRADLVDALRKQNV